MISISGNSLKEIQQQLDAIDPDVGVSVSGSEAVEVLRDILGKDNFTVTGDFIQYGGMFGSVKIPIDSL